MSECTILFADIAGSTAMYETLGDELAESIINQALAALSGIVVEHKGRVIDTIGDEIMCQFPDAQQAILAAEAMHICTNTRRFGSTKRQVAVRIGAHAGEVISGEQTVHGDTVNVSARIAALARPGKTMISEITFESLPDAQKSLCRYLLEAQLKGKEQLVRLYDVVWEVNDQLTRVASIPRKSAALRKLVLTYHEKSVSLSQGTLKIGRAEDSDLCVSSSQASRYHCEIRLNGNRFTLYDTSTNGTFVVQNNVEMLFHHETAPLHRSGVISLGLSTKHLDESEYIHFSIEHAESPA